MAIENKKNVKLLKTFTCPACGGEIALRTGANALTAVCRHCSSVIDVADERFQVIQKAQQKAVQTLIPLGTRGELHGVTWEATGFMKKTDATGQYAWDEYLLFNPYHGYRFLVQMDGHWNFVSPVRKYVPRVPFQARVMFEGEKYKVFLRDRPRVAAVQGEFYWQVRKGDQSSTEDFILPPRMISIETSDGETVTSLCEYTEPDDIKDAFGLNFMPRRKGVFANQPYAGDTPHMRMTAMIAVGIAFALCFFAEARARSEIVLSKEVVFQPAERGKTFVSDPIRIEYTQNMLVETVAAVDNQWAEVSYELANQDAAETYSFVQGVEYYHGVSDGESWSEGSRDESAYFAAIKPGTYKLLYEVDSGSFPVSPVQMSIKATRDEPSIGNFFWTVFLILLWPVFAGWRHHVFETRRWENSDLGGG